MISLNLRWSFLQSDQQQLYPSWWVPWWDISESGRSLMDLIVPSYSVIQCKCHQCYHTSLSSSVGQNVASSSHLSRCQYPTRKIRVRNWKLLWFQAQSGLVQHQHIILHQVRSSHAASPPSRGAKIHHIRGWLQWHHRSR